MHGIKLPRKVASIGGACALLLVLAACGSTVPSSTHAPTHPTPHAHITTPTPSPTPETLEQMFNAGPAPEGVVQQLDSPTMSADQFDEAPKADQLKWLSWKINNKYAAYAAQFYAESQNPNDVYPSSVSIDNTPQQAMTIAMYAQRMADSMPNALDAQKALIASLPDGQKDGGYTSGLKAIGLDSGRYIQVTPKQETPSSLMPTVDSTSGIMTDAAGRKYQQVETTVSGTDGNGIQQSEALKYNLFFYTFTDFKGNTVSIWLPS